MGWLPQLVVQAELAAGTVTEVGDQSWSADLEVRLLRSRARKVGAQAGELWQRAEAAIVRGS